MDVMNNPEMNKTLCKKMGPPLVTLLSAEPEIQYVALRNINLIIQKRPTILANDIKVSPPLTLSSPELTPKRTTVDSPPPR
eukprot:4718402-Pyramimonas_sp.AAC.1